MIKLQAVKITCVSRYKVLADKRLIDQRFDLCYQYFYQIETNREMYRWVLERKVYKMCASISNRIQRALAALFGSFYAKERYCLIARDYHAYGC